ncbi:MAG: mevalonate kinase, partial [Candidatus Aenigmarchaeota archaeon]|nr:mevalonate kinase [Candidatus Aenigmarchaeota archaeon]
KEKMKDNLKEIDNIFDGMKEITEKSKDIMINSDWKALGEKLTENQRLLANLGVSSPELNRLIAAAVGAGAYGAKLSGAGGGDCMIALAEDNREAVERAITSAGGILIPVETNAEGVRVE